MAAISFTGLGSGIDMASIVQALIDTERQSRIGPFEDWRTEWASKTSALQELNIKLASLHTAVKAIDRPNEFLVKSATSSDEDVITATAGSSALSGSYSIEIGTNIQHRLGSKGYADKDTTAVAAQNDQIQITVGSTTDTVTLPADPTPATNYTLEDVATAINDSANWAGAVVLATAEVVDDGSTSNQYRLVLTAASGGSSNSITIGTNDTSVDFAMSGAGDRIDTAEGTLNGTASVTSGGQYLGTTNKTFTFTIAGSSTTEYTVGTDEFDVAWTDSEGNSGTVTIDSTSAVTVFQGLTVQFSAGTAQGGDTFTIDVWNADIQAAQDNGLAKAEKEIHAGFADEDTTAVTTVNGTFYYTYNGQVVELEVSAGTTLTELVNLINTDSDNPGVTASIIHDGTGLPTAYHLVLSGNNTGAAYKISFDTTHTLDNFSTTFTEGQSAQNAMLQIDGYPADDSYLQRASNTIGDLITGVNLTLVGDGTANVTVTTDTEAVKENITTFVTAFNEVRSYIKEQTYYNTETEETGILLGNYAVDTIKNRLNSIVSTNPSGFRDGYDSYINLMQIGIYTDADQGSDTQGQLLIDESVLDSALADDPDAVADLFSEYFLGRSAHSSLDFESYIAGITEAGTYEIEFDSAFPSQSRIRPTDSSTWYDVSWDATNDTLTILDGPGKGMEIRVNDTLQSFTGEVDLKLGLAGVLKDELDFLTDPSDGPVGILNDNYQDIIDSIDEKIELEEKRLALYERRLTERFARLEGVLAELNQQSAYISNAVASFGQ